jgi:hypothetical protein
VRVEADPAVALVMVAVTVLQPKPALTAMEGWCAGEPPVAVGTEPKAALFCFVVAKTDCRRNERKPTTRPEGRERDRGTARERNQRESEKREPEPERGRQRDRECERGRARTSGSQGDRQKRVYDNSSSRRDAHPQNGSCSVSRDTSRRLMTAVSVVDPPRDTTETFTSSTSAAAARATKRRQRGRTARAARQPIRQPGRTGGNETAAHAHHEHAPRTRILRALHARTPALCVRAHAPSVSMAPLPWKLLGSCGRTTASSRSSRTPNSPSTTARAKGCTMSLKSRPPLEEARPPGLVNCSCDTVAEPFSTRQPSSARPLWK